MTRYSLGVDYASLDNNAVPDLGRLRAAGLRFVWLRGSLGTWPDPTAARDREAVRAAGLVFGAYLAPKIAAGAPAPAVQVAAFAAAAGLQRGVDLAPAIDVEFGHGIAATGMSIPQIAAWLGQLVAAVREVFGCNPIVYSSARVLEDRDTDTLAGGADAVLAGCPLWLTRYLAAHEARYDAATLSGLPAPRVPAFVDADGWWIHQYQGDAQHFPSLHQVDLDRFNCASSTTRGTRRSWLVARLGSHAATDAQLDQDIRAFQRQRQLAVDGVVGPATFAALSWNA